MAIPTPDDVRQALTAVIDPELQQNIVDLGLVYDVRVSAVGLVNVDMTLTTPYCPRASEILSAVRATVRALPGVTAVDVQLVWHPPWTPHRMAESLRAPLGLSGTELIPPTAPAATTWRTRMQRLRQSWQRKPSVP